MSEQVSVVELFPQGDQSRLWTVVDRESGSLITSRKFTVTRAGGTPHTVTVEVGEDGFTDAERCDCDGYRYRGGCAHINAALAWADEHAPFSYDADGQE